MLRLDYLSTNSTKEENHKKALCIKAFTQCVQVPDSTNLMLHFKQKIDIWLRGYILNNNATRLWNIY